MLKAGILIEDRRMVRKCLNSTMETVAAAISAVLNVLVSKAGS